MKKHYTNVKLFTQRDNGIKYILELTTNAGYANEYYEFTDRLEAKEARAKAMWLHEHQYCKQEFEDFENMGKLELTVIKGLLGTMKQTKNLYKWCMQ